MRIIVLIIYVKNRTFSIANHNFTQNPFYDNQKKQLSKVNVLVKSHPMASPISSIKSVNALDCDSSYS